MHLTLRIWPKHFWIVLLAFPFINSCIGEDVIDDFVQPALRIDNPVQTLQVSETHQFSATYFNNIGLPEETMVVWSSSDDGVIAVDASGSATAIASGSATIKAEVTSDNQQLTQETPVTVTEEDIPDTGMTKAGTIRTTSSYALSGKFTIEETDNGIIIKIDEDYVASRSLPGLYLYLTNNPNSINGALEVGAVQVFEGAHSYTLPGVGINDHSHLLYWCKPFSVKVGEGTIE
ncbi:MAG: hypothetical protein WBG71_12405 [Leeuwenhoekiella sp.]